ncbi:immunoglobulin kappa light chain-like [Perca fluviatilis]|uniref:immunoglobulin kappa light chain-like n=1 Tax=Perca fluviatilis TaxID=8168 RepID=UPI0019638CAC|nr:immunoglobulin kappa light chain-like [Perca fluviatilis]
MTSLKFALHLTCLCLWRIATASTQKLKLSPSVLQETGFISANVGDNVTLQCFYKDDVAAMFFWYKQTLGQKPRLISTFYKHDKKGTFIDELKNDPRFTLETKNGNYHLTISELRISDSATYYCISIYAYQFQFTEGITVDVKGSGLKIPATVHQSASESIQPGGSVTLDCTVHTGTCDGEHSVYWFKNSEESQPGLIYTHGGRNDQCERKPNTQTHTCVYNLPIKNLSLSHNMTYYCAVASCGHILFGNGTKLELEDKVESPESLVYFLSAALAFTTILVVLLAFSVYKVNKRNSCQCKECQTASNTANAEGYQDVDNLHYAALRDPRTNRPRKVRDNTVSECVYSSVRQ